MMAHEQHFPKLMQQERSRTTLVMAAAAAALSVAATTNQKGVEFFEAGDMPNAYESFKACLEILNQAELSLLLEKYTQDTELAPCSQPTEPLLSQDDLKLHATLSQQLEALLRTNPPTFLEGRQDPSRCFQKCAFYVYRKPFLIAPELTPITRERLALYKARVMFNLAMVMHQGENCVDKPSVHKSLNLYDLCLEYSMMHNGVTSSDIGWLMLTIASLNNKAHVFHEFCESQSLRTVLETLYLALIYLPQNVYAVQGEAMQGILFNVYMLRDLHCARAA